MNRLMTFGFCVLVCALPGVPAGADDPPKKLTPEGRKELEAKYKELVAAGFKAYRADNLLDSATSFEDALKLARQIYPESEFPDGHGNLARCLSNLATLYRFQGRLTEAEPLFKDALEMQKRVFKGDHPDTAVGSANLGMLYGLQGRYAEAEPLLKDALEIQKRVFKGDHPDTARCLINLATLYRSQGRLTEAEPLLKDALEMQKRVFKGDHPDTAASLSGLGLLYRFQGRYAEAEPLFKDALEMQKRVFKGDHPDTARYLNNVGFLYHSQGKLTEAEPFYKDGLEMQRRVVKGDHPFTVESLNNLGMVYKDQGRYAEAEPLLKDALEMQKRVFKGDHPDTAGGLSNLGLLYYTRLKYDEAEPLFKTALEMYSRLATRFAREKTEGDTLTFLASLPLMRDAFLSNELARDADPATVYQHVWFDKGAIARVYEFRQQRTRAAAAGAKTAKMLAELADARRRRAELLLAPATRDAATLKKRDEDIKNYENRIDELARELNPLLPVISRADKLAAARPGDLQKVLPPDAAVVDFLRFVRIEQDGKTPGKRGEKRTARYLAFVVSKDRVAWVDLDTAANVESTVNAWREAITGDPLKKVPPAPADKARELGGKVRGLVWEKVRKALPSNTKTLYVCPDATLCELPWGALPGDRPDSILLEEFAVATIPHAPFLLDKLWGEDAPKKPPTSALVVGGVKYDAELAPPNVGGSAKNAAPLVKPGARLGWPSLGNTIGEADGIAAAARRMKLTATRLDGDRATTPAVLAALPRARYAHFATHGFFADPSFRGLFQLDEKDYEKSSWGERVGRAANSPLVMTGLVLAGANNEKTPGRGILTGEHLIDLDLSGLELAVLSACETGLGDLAGGEGVYGLQRAFHYAGARDVVASLWKVPDEPTAALMALFYRNLWEENLPPAESLRRAQLEVYKNPSRIPQLAKGFRGTFDEVPGDGAAAANLKPGADGKAHPLLWAAFSLSGPGR